MWYYRRTEKISLTDRVRKEEVLQIVKEEKNVRQTNWSGHIVRRNCLLKHVIEGKVEVRTAVAGRR
jgi:hypothetical protein